MSTTASKTYGLKIDELLTLVRALESDVTESIVDAHSTHWGHIGDVTRAIELAKQLRDLLRGTVDQVAA